jgi:hypothetical protein
MRSAILGERLTAQLLAGPPAGDPAAATERLLAVQAQDPRGVRLAIRARTRAPTLAAFERALGEERALLITSLNRFTLHLVRSEDYFWLHALTTPPLGTANRRRLEQEGVSPAQAERGVGVIERSLGADGPLTRDELRARIAAAGVPTAGQAFVHILALASLRGLIVRGPMRGSAQAFVLVRDWLGPAPRFDRDRALAELARRYLAGHGPAEDRDLARWSGLPLRDARSGLQQIAAELDQRQDGLLALRGRRRAAALPAPRLLGAFEPVLLGWASREFVTGGHAARIVSGGVFRPFALVGGVVAGGWRLARDTIALEPFDVISAADRRALDAEGEQIVSYLRGD